MLAGLPRCVDERRALPSGSAVFARPMQSLSRPRFCALSGTGHGVTVPNLICSRIDLYVSAPFRGRSRLLSFSLRIDAL